MVITKLIIEDLRLIERLVLEPAAGINFIVGGNGAGKTTILEAIYLAGRGRTFRHSAAGPMIRRGSEAATVLTYLFDEVQNSRRLLGLRRGRTDLECRLDGDDVRRRSTLAETLPVQWMGSQPQQFLERGPEVRRRFFDMGLFHVEHDYLQLYAELNRSLKQRNAALKTGNPNAVAPWDQSFAKAAQELDARRSAFVADLLGATAGMIGSWRLGFEVAYRYRRGWRVGAELVDELNRKLELDLANGFTSVGPQRAEIEILTEGALAERTLSRGQQKMLVMALNLALIDLMRKRQRRGPVVLVDDLAAELDPDNQRRIVEAFYVRSVQAFFTSIQDPAGHRSAESAPVFHVEQGRLLA